MPPKPEIRAEDERPARLAREWPANARHREAEEAAAEPSRKRSDGDGGFSGSGGFFDGSDGGGDGGRD